MRLALCRLIDDLVGSVDRIAQYDGLSHESAVRVDAIAFLTSGTFCSQIGDDLYGNTACDLASIVSAHTISKNQQADFSNGTDSILVMLTDTPRVGELGKIYLSGQIHRVGSLSLNRFITDFT